MQQSAARWRLVWASFIQWRAMFVSATHYPPFPGYDTFWSCCQAKEYKGFNGVATYARKGLTVRLLVSVPAGHSSVLTSWLFTSLQSYANSAPLGDPLLDSEGRALLTVHGELAIVNVYVPNASAGQRRLPFKVGFSLLDRFLCGDQSIDHPTSLLHTRSNSLKHCAAACRGCVMRA